MGLGRYMTESDGRNMHTFIIMQTIMMQTLHSQHYFYCYTSNKFLNGGGNVLILHTLLHSLLHSGHRLEHQCYKDVMIIISSRLVVTRIELLEE